MPGYSVTISAVDQASPTIRRVNTGLEQIGARAGSLRAPLEAMNASLGRFASQTGISRLATDMSGLGQKISGTIASLGRFAPALGAVTGAASIAGLAQLVNRWTEFGSRLGLDAQRIGVTAENLNRMQGAARLAGSSAEALTGGMQSLRDNLVNAAAGRSPETVQMLAALGISMRDAAGHARSASDIMPEVADRIARVQDPTQRAMIATTLFGSAGENLLPFLQRGSRAMASYATEADRYGVTNWRGVEAARALQGEQSRLALAVEGVGNSISEKVAPVLVPMLRNLSDWIKDHRDEIAGFFQSVATAIKGWVDGGGIGKLIESLQAVYNTLARIVGIADAVGHALRRIWDRNSPVASADNLSAERRRLMGLPELPRAGAVDDRTWWQRNAPTALGGREAPAATPAPTTAEQESKGRAARDMLVRLGWTPAQAAGIVSNLHQESGFNPAAIGDSGTAQGLAQWHADRRAAIAAGTGINIGTASFEDQIRAVDWELRNTERRAGDALRATTTAAQAGDVVSRLYERPAATEAEAAQRGASATRWDARLATEPTVAAAPAVPTVSPAQANTGAPGAPGPDGKATVRLMFENAPAGLQTRTAATGGLRIETPALGNVP